MAWIRWRETLEGQRLADIQWRDDLGKVHSKALKTDDEAVAQTYLCGSRALTARAAATGR
jgi:hypothetical protein